MKKCNVLFWIIILNTGLSVYAQEWTVRDSVWLQRVLEGSETIRLNEDTRKAIESGTLLRDPTFPKELKINEIEMPIIKSFEGITTQESQRQLQPHELSISVYKYYLLEQLKDTVPIVRKEAFTFSMPVEEEYKKATVDDPFTMRPAGGGAFNAENILRYIFWPSHRAKVRNAKNANAWKTYNEYE